MTMLNTSSSQVFGIIRNANLAKLYYPNWDFRVYSALPEIPRQIKSKFQALHIKIKQLTETGFPVSMLHYDVLFHEETRAVLFRNPLHRISRRESTAVNHWIREEHHLMHAIVDHPSHLKTLINPGLFAFRNTQNNFTHQFRVLFKEFLREVGKDEEDANEIELSQFVFSKTLDLVDVSVHQGLHCQAFRDFPTIHPLNMTEREEGEVYCGQTFDANEIPADDGAMLLDQWTKTSHC